MTRVAVSNYRGIEDFEVPVRKHSVLVGPNESGKTSILRGLDLLLGSPQQRIYSTVSAHDFTDTSRQLVIEAHLGHLNDEELAAFPDEVDLTLDQPVVPYRLEIDCLDEATGELDVRRLFPRAGHDRPPTRDQTDLLAWSFVPADRDLVRDLSAGRRGVLRRLLAAVDLTDSHALDEAMRHLREAFGAESGLATFRADLAEALADSLPTGPNPRVDLILRGDLEGNPLGSVELALARGDKSSPRLLHEQSDGTRALAAMAVYSMAAANNGTVAVDEPEMHLHPTAQRAVGRLVANVPAQSIIATHSASVVAEADPHDIIAFPPSGEPRTLKPGSAATHPQFAARWWTAGLVDLLTSRRVAIVEGPADRIIVERAAWTHGIDLSRMGIALLDLEGAEKLKHAVSILGSDGFDISFRALGDEDKRTSWAKYVGEPYPYNLESHGFTMSNEDLEDEYVRALGHRRMVHLLAMSGYITLKQVRDVIGATSLTAASSANILKVCRRYKIEAAACLAHCAEDQEVERISSVGRFVRTLAS